MINEALEHENTEVSEENALFYLEPEDGNGIFL
jgi:hypothetical protein